MNPRIEEGREAMFILIICLLVGAVLAMGLNVFSLLPATMIAIFGIVIWDFLQASLSASSVQACAIAIFSLQVGYASGLGIRYLLTAPAPVAAPVSLHKRNKKFATRG